jgi:hypothetical protein
VIAPKYISESQCASNALAAERFCKAYLMFMRCDFGKIVIEQQRADNGMRQVFETESAESALAWLNGYHAAMQDAKKNLAGSDDL